MIVEYKYKGKKFLKVQINHFDEAGKRHQTNTRFDENKDRITSLRKAKEIESGILFQLKSRIKSEKHNVTFDTFLKQYLSNLHTESRATTADHYKRTLAKWVNETFLGMSISKIRKKDIHSLVAHIEENGGSCRIRRSVVSQIFQIMKEACQRGLTSENPAEGVKIVVPPPVKKVLNSEEASTLIKESRKDNHDFHYIWVVALLTGMRNGELYALRWSNVDLDERIIHVRSSWNNALGLHLPKGGKIRAIPISKKLYEVLKKLKELGPFKENLAKKNEKGKVLVNDLVLPRSPQWKAERQSFIIKKYCNKINITPIKFHDLRATFITNILSQGCPLAKVMSMVGHARTQTTDVYLRMSGVDLKGATENLSYKSFDKNLPISSQSSQWACA